MKELNAYLVGGAVRDKLLGFESKDRDWVVVGHTPDDMLAAGFKQVGADFPVFLHPETREEYALARTERKQGHGYHGFECYSAPDVSIEDDLKRRDLTINAMAMTKSGEIIDPFDGQSDLNNKLLRHVSEAFAEDPLRILRVARFAARLAPFGFKVADETLNLMQAMVSNGEAGHLVAERVWQETQRALLENSPRIYFEVLRECNALAVVFPEIDALFGVPQPEKYHPEIDCGIHTLMSLEQACLLSDSLDVRYATLLHDLGKALTPADVLPSHYGHESTGVKKVKALNKRLKAPKHCCELALIACEFHTHIHRAFELKSQTVLNVLKRCDAFRRHERFEKMLICCKADSRGRTGYEDVPYLQADYFSEVAEIARKVNIQYFREQGLDGKELGAAIDRERCRLIQEAKEKWAKK